MEFEKRCWAQIDLDRLEENFAFIRSRVPHSQIMAVIKADGYGHGDSVTAYTLQKAGADQFAVSNFTEAVRLRKAGIRQPILILGYTDPSRAPELAAQSIRQCVYSLPYAQALSGHAQAAGVTVPIHIKLDTGMGRIGFSATATPALAAQEAAAACRLPGLRPEGIFTHFAASDSALPEHLAYTKQQFELFCQTIELLGQHKIVFPVRHCCNSAAIFAHPEMQLDMVRAGIILYGCAPSDDICCTGLKPVLSLRAVVSHIKKLPAGCHVSYGCTFQAKTDRLIATLTAGYADGYPRALSNMGVVDLHGKPAKVVGRVCMDQMMVDVTDIPGVKPQDEAILFGAGAADSTAQAAQKCNTIPYELLCQISRRVPRIYMHKGNILQIADYLNS
ncbi:MAG: alanine racemase [Pygmaiobacter massiliensis]|nr:alanine racemase [Pygmaiobacter massiliensis]